MTNAIERLAALHAAATGGEWYINDLIGPTHIAVREPFRDVAVVFTDGRLDLAEASSTAAFIAAIKNATPALLACVEALAELLAANIVEYGEPDDGAADESVGWNGDGSPMPFKYGHMQRARAALSQLAAQERST